MRTFAISITILLIVVLTTGCGAATPAPTAAPAVAPTSAPTAVPPTVAPTAVPATATAIPPTATAVPPTPTSVPPSATPIVLTPTLAPTKTPAPIVTPIAVMNIPIQLFAFHPQTLQVKVGTKVIWTNMDDIQHSITNGVPPNPAANAAFNSDFFEKGQTFEFTFTQPGDYTYFCRRHNSMTGDIKVVAQ